MAMRKKTVRRPAASRRPKRTEPHPDYVFTIRVVSGRVVIDGTNDGNIRADPEELIRFTFEGRGPGFTISATDFRKNKDRRRRRPARQAPWPFKQSPDEWPVKSFEVPLIKPGFGLSPKIFKYTVEVGRAKPADPIIIIDR
jgi:hypothetical protein